MLPPGKRAKTSSGLESMPGIYGKNHRDCWIDLTENVTRILINRQAMLPTDNRQERKVFE